MKFIEVKPGVWVSKRLIQYVETDGESILVTHGAGRDLVTTKVFTDFDDEFDLEDVTSQLTKSISNAWFDSIPDMVTAITAGIVAQEAQP